MAKINIAGALYIHGKAGEKSQLGDQTCSGRQGWWSSGIWGLSPPLLEVGGANI